jgi:hypothetical protein
MSPFARYIGIDYSGAETADSSCKGTQSGLDKSGIFAPRRSVRYWIATRSISVQRRIWSQNRNGRIT